jgi:hypothetical protein
MSDESADYLKGIADRMFAYDSIREYVLDFITDRGILDEEITLGLLVIGFLWEAEQRKEVLTEDEVNLLLGVEEDEDFTLDDMEPNVRFQIDQDRADLKLDELLDLTYYELISTDPEDQEDFNN